MEKIKVSFLIDKEEVKKCAFGVSGSIEEYREVEKVISESGELVRDAEKIEDERQKRSTNDLFSRAALDIIIDENKGLIISKRCENFEKNGVDANARRLVESIEKLLGKED